MEPTCPACGAPRLDPVSCLKCGIVFDRWDPSRASAHRADPGESHSAHVGAGVYGAPSAHAPEGGSRSGGPVPRRRRPATAEPTRLSPRKPTRTAKQKREDALWIAVVGVIGVFIVAFILLKPSGPRGGSHAGAGAGAQTCQASNEGGPLTDVDAAAFERTLDDAAGCVVLVEFWATWCPYCVRMEPSLSAITARYEGQGFVLRSFSTDDSYGEVASHVAGRTYRYPVGHLTDPDGRAFRRALRSRGIRRWRGLPAFVIIGRDGEVIDAWSGALPEHALDERVRAALRRR